MIILRKTPYQKFSKSLSHVAQVQQIVIDLTEHEVRKMNEKIGFLYSAYIIYLVALWETFLKDLLIEASEAIVERKNYSDNISRSLKDRLRLNKDEFEKLTDDEISAHYKSFVADRLKGFNSAKPEKVDSVFYTALGYRNLTNNWVLDDLPTEKVQNRLIEIIDIRGDIAHGVYSQEPLTYNGNFEYMYFINLLAIKTQDLVNSYFEKTTGDQLYK